MGSGYDMKCSKCGYSYSRMEGIGFYFPIAYRETIEKARKEYVTVQSSVPNSYKNIPELFMTRSNCH